MYINHQFIFNTSFVVNIMDIMSFPAQSINEISDKSYQYSSHNKPILLNVDLTFDCNMRCDYCVAEDLRKIVNKDLQITDKLIEWINKSPFSVIVITGGEPLLPNKESKLLELISRIKRKNLVIDSNGLVLPSKKILRNLIRKKVLLRVSMDSNVPEDEIFCRKIKNGTDNTSLLAYHRKRENLRKFSSLGINLAIQTVLYKKNQQSIQYLPNILDKIGIKNWFVQRLILSHKITDQEKFAVDFNEYRSIIFKLKRICTDKGINLVGKLDKNHNSVFLLAGDGELYTQGNKPREKVFLGNIESDLAYFDNVSMKSHNERYAGMIDPLINI